MESSIDSLQEAMTVCCRNKTISPYVYVCMYVCMYVCICIVSHYFSLLALSGTVLANILLYNLDLFVIMNVCMYICMYVLYCMYVYMYV